MKLGFKKNLLVVFLSLAVIIVWGIIISRTITYFTEDDQNIIINKDNSDFYKDTFEKPNNAKSKQIKYIKLNRDPFIIPRPKIKPVHILKSSKRVNKKPGINYSINGVIINGKSKLLILDDKTNNKTIFLREGEEYEGIKILKINTDMINIIDHGLKRELSLKRH